MTNVCLRPVTRENYRACVRLRVEDDQLPFVATNMESLAQAYVNPRLTPRAIYKGDVFGRLVTADDPMVGFVMYQVWDEIGFIMRLMVDAAHQRKGYGRAAMLTVVRLLKADARIERIATSVIPTNDAARELYLRLPYGRDA